MMIVGAGIVGLTIARELSQRWPDARLLLLEQEHSLAAHQSGHNSGVIHSGIYYRPGSLKARLTLESRARLLRFLDEEKLPYEISGKLVVAVRPEELAKLRDLYENGRVNHVPGIRLMGQEAMREVEPHVRGLKAIYVPSTGITDYRQIALRVAERLAERGVIIQTGEAVKRLQIQPHMVVAETQTGLQAAARYLIAAAGIQADRLARAAGLKPASRIIPVRGGYWTLLPHSRHLVRSLIYPVPDPRLPFLGVHFTRRISDQAVWVGPNAVLASHRTQHRRGALNLRDLADTAGFPGFWRLARRFWRFGAGEWYRDHWIFAYLRQAQAYVPELTRQDLSPGPFGIRAQLVDADGAMVDDFRIMSAGRALFVLNAPSPAATASFAIARHVVDEGARNFGWTLLPPQL